MKTILVPVNFLNASEKALIYIENVFRDQSVKLDLLYVLPEDTHISESEIKNQYKKFEAKVLFGYPLPYEFRIVHGILLDEIQHAINETKPALVVLGTSGTALTKALVKLTDSPVMIVPEGSLKRKIKNIAYANDFNTVKSSEAFSALLDLSRGMDAKVHIIHINKDDRVTPDEAEPSIEYYLQKIEHEYASIKSNDFVAAIQDYVRDQNIDVLTVLLRDHGNNQLNSHGKLIEEIVSQTEIPVLSLV